MSVTTCLVVFYVASIAVVTNTLDVAIRSGVAAAVTAAAGQRRPQLVEFITPAALAVIVLFWSAVIMFYRLADQPRPWPIAVAAAADKQQQQQQTVVAKRKCVLFFFVFHSKVAFFFSTHARFPVRVATGWSCVRSCPPSIVARASLALSSPPARPSVRRRK